ncbi:hypothetical protein ACF065_20345 [Streptomyces sp. NPDC015232]|uniref:hypothetical protein n=1 Tax=unclassified Streptomyces TaxID=2593676 RepID=UPI0036FE2042
MSRVRLTLATALVGIAALTACSSGGAGPDPTDSARTTDGKPAPAPRPITEELSQAHLAQALLGDGETLPGWTLHGDKSATDGEYCNGSDDADSAPKGWVRGSDSSYEYDGSTDNMTHVMICLFDSPEAAHREYTAWKGTEPNKEQRPRTPLGDENTLVVNPGLSEDSVYGYLRSGKVNIRVRTEGGTAGDPSGTQAVLAATLKRLQQLQDGGPATVTAQDERAAARQ